MRAVRTENNDKPDQSDGAPPGPRIVREDAAGIWILGCVPRQWLARIEVRLFLEAMARR